MSAESRIVLLGPPGVGKGTQAGRICEALRIPHIATGDLLRENVRSATPLGREARAFMDRGELVPDDLVIRMVEDRLSRSDCVRGFLLDGFPRSVPQADALDQVLAFSRTPLAAVFYMTAPEELIVERLAGRRVCPRCNRSYHLRNIPPREEGVCDDCTGALVLRDDDRPETVRKRLEIYLRQTSGLVDRYRAQGILREVDGAQAPEVLERRILEILGAQEESGT